MPSPTPSTAPRSRSTRSSGFPPRPLRTSPGSTDAQFVSRRFDAYTGRMSDLGLAAITFLATLGAALIATVVRTLLPPTHMSHESQDIVRLGMGLVASMTALLLG